MSFLLSPPVPELLNTYSPSFSPVCSEFVAEKGAELDFFKFLRLAIPDFVGNIR